MKKSLLAIITLSVFLGACGKNIDMDNAATDVAVVEDTVSEDITLAAKTGEDKADEALSNIRELEKGAHTDDKPDVAPEIEDMDPLYKKFLKGEISVTLEYYKFSINDYLEYFPDYERATIGYCLLDVNSDGNDELIVEICSPSSCFMYVIATDGKELKCYDFNETHNYFMGFVVYSNGVFRWEQHHTGGEEKYYIIDEAGEIEELIFFYKDIYGLSTLEYDYYYLNGDKNDIHTLSSDEEYERIAAEYKGNRVEYIDCADYVKYYQ